MLALLLPVVFAIVRLPEEFNADLDFAEKEKWLQHKRDLRCPVCKLAVGHAYDNVEFKEDAIYDYFERLCDQQDLYKKHTIVVETSIRIEKAPDQDFRDAHVILWQAHTLQETCDDFVKSNIDDLKDVFLASQNLVRENATEHRTAIVSSACEKIKVCTREKTEL